MRCYLAFNVAALVAVLACSEVAEVLSPALDTGDAGDLVDAGSGGTPGDASTDTDGDAAPDVDTPPADAGGGGIDLVMVDAGNDHSCAVVRGALFCWGGNQRGRLGVGDTESRAAPARVGSLDTWVEVAAAADHSCARRQDGTVWCFGANDVGQLGLPGVNDVLSPIAVSLSRPALGVSSEVDFTCALLENGTLHCWGENTEGMLGQDDSYPGEHQFSPQQVADYQDFIAVDAGQGHACALREPGSLWCWGRNSGHQLGLGPDAAVQFRAPTRVGGQSDWFQASAGQNHSCGLRAEGELWCWGENTFGNLGTGDLTTRTEPVRVDARQYVQVSLDTFHTCAIDVNADLWCWGRNVEGQLGLGDNEDRLLPTRSAAGGWEQVAVGRFHTCAKMLDHSIWCTGENEVGQLGVGDTERRNELTPILLSSE